MTAPRADKDRGRTLRMEPEGVANMSNEEFWAACERTRPTLDGMRNYGTRQGRLAVRSNR